MDGLHLKIQEKFPQAVTETHSQHGDETVVIVRENLLQVMRFLKEDAAFDMSILMDLTAVDRLWMNEAPRYEVVYHLFSMAKNHRLRVKVRLSEQDPQVPSVTALWPVADWFEREAWDMFGITFQGHPNLKRILLYEGFVGHPLRKDYPINKRQPLIGPGSKVSVPDSGATS